MFSKQQYFMTTNSALIALAIIAACLCQDCRASASSRSGLTFPFTSTGGKDWDEDKDTTRTLAQGDKVVVIPSFLEGEKDRQVMKGRVGTIMKKFYDDACCDNPTKQGRCICINPDLPPHPQGKVGHNKKHFQGHFYKCRNYPEIVWQVRFGKSKRLVPTKALVRVKKYTKPEISAVTIPKADRVVPQPAGASPASSSRQSWGNKTTGALPKRRRQPALKIGDMVTIETYEKKMKGRTFYVKDIQQRKDGKCVTLEYDGDDGVKRRTRIMSNFVVPSCGNRRRLATGLPIDRFFDEILEAQRVYDSTPHALPGKP